MARIREYENPIDGLRTSQAGAEATARAGSTAANLLYFTGQSIASATNRLGAAAADVYEQHIVQPEIAKGATLMTTIQNEMTVKWREFAQTADVNDTTIGDRFREEVLQPRMEQFLGGFQTRRGMTWAQQQTESFTRHMNDRVLADQSSRAGHAATVNLMTVGNNLMAQVSHDPSSFDYAISQVDANIGAVVKNSPNLSPEAAAKAQNELAFKMKNGIAEAYINALAKESPEKAQKVLESGKLDPYLTGTDRVQMERYIRGERRVIEHEGRQARLERERLQKEATDAKLTQIMNDNIVVGEDGKVIIKPGYFKAIFNDLSRMPSADPRLVNFALQAGRAIQHEAEREVKVHTDPATYEEFNRRVLSEDDPLTMTDVFKAKAEGKLDTKDFHLFSQWLQQEFRDPEIRKQEQHLSRFFNGFKGVITNSSILLPQGDPLGQIKFYELQRDMRADMRAQRKAGRPIEEILDGWLKKLEYYVPNRAAVQDRIVDRATGNTKGLIGAPKAAGSKKTPVDPDRAMRPDETVAEYALRLQRLNSGNR